MLASFFGIGDGSQGITQTVDMMVENVQRDSSDPTVIQLAHNIVSGTGYGKKAAAEAIFDWCKNNTRYTLDPTDVEMLMTPKYMLITHMTMQQPITADCDDMSQLIACLLRSIGIKSGFRQITVHGRRWHHIYALCHVREPYCRQYIYPMDLTERSFKFGDEHKYLMAKDTWC